MIDGLYQGYFGQDKCAVVNIVDYVSDLLTPIGLLDKNWKLNRNGVIITSVYTGKNL